MDVGMNGGCRQWVWFCLCLDYHPKTNGYRIAVLHSVHICFNNNKNNNNDSSNTTINVGPRIYETRRTNHLSVRSTTTNHPTLISPAPSEPTLQRSSYPASCVVVPTLCVCIKMWGPLFASLPLILHTSSHTFINTIYVLLWCCHRVAFDSTLILQSCALHEHDLYDHTFINAYLIIHIIRCCLPHPSCKWVSR